MIRNHEAAQMFVDNQKELRMTAERHQEPRPKESRVESMIGGEVLGTALITWRRSAEDEIGVAGKVVLVVWARVCKGRSQIHPEWAASCETKMDRMGSV